MFHLGWFLSYMPQAWTQLHGDRGGNFPKPDAFVELARSLERAGFDFLMIEDGSFVSDAYGSSMEYALTNAFETPKHDPMTLMPLLAASTEHLGIIATMTTSFYPPFLAARLMATLDHLSEGRVGFNLVTAHNDRTAQNYGLEKHYDHAQRYAMAAEWAEVVTALLRSWDADAVILDEEADIFADHDKIHHINFEGEYFKSRGPLNAPPGPQGVPVICQAGGSPAGRAFASGIADTIVAPGGSIEQMKAYRDDIRARAAAAGRDPDSIKVMFLAEFVVGDTDEDAAELHRRKVQLAAGNFEKRIAFMSFASGIDFKQFDLDSPPPRIETNAAKTTTDAQFAGQDGKTLREIASQVDAGLEFIGSPEAIADQMEAAMAAIGGDGFLVLAPVTSRAIADITGDLAPVLRRRGLIRDGYDASTLRGNLQAF